ncbi:hypothetical protein GGI02_003100 [Coemansia sp. RSA 2322]|uniref:SMAD/FHA domain-containing protein n=1 Tax=Coemansia thaxteri TaxID=2663907 RepID=A0A9W8EFG8_9FUNG|nr:hypothetical protein H4R26_002980 [Coemansia thaxteri]KAJ2470179.1 hypothetical protein GGI02_003100 [Coemansia sp. RSA 2322]
MSSEQIITTTLPEAAGDAGNAGPRVPHIRIVPHIVDVRHCLYFDVMNRDVPESAVLKVGRFTEKVSQQMSRIAFKSKVVSRSHAEIWTEGGQFYIKDTKSSSGTFLNHMRLSPPGQESRPHPLHDGDILQLGVDYQGGSVDIYKCVKIRLEINRNWQRSKENPFRRQVMENIQNAYHAMGDGGNSNECCICLYQMVAFQALFVAPCSHCFHFKCVKPILFTSTGFSCPLCRTYADLEASVTVDETDMDVDAKPPVLPPAVQTQQQQTWAAAAAAAEDAVAAAEESAANADVSADVSADAGADVGADAGAGANADAVRADRDDANATPVPNASEQAAIDSFGTTPVGSMPTNLAAHLSGMDAADASLVGAGGGPLEAEQPE